jgi:hypothetical protein
MACTNYSNNASANVVFSMSALPGGFCPANFQALMDAVAQYLVGTLPGNYSTFLISDTEPAAADRDKLWVSVDTNCKPIGFFLFNTTYGEWLPVGQKVFDGGTAGGTANALTATADPELKYLADGCMFIVKAGASTNTGAATLNVSGTGTYPVTKQGNQTLSGGEIRPNMVLLLNARDLLTVPYYELLNPSPAQAALDPQDRVVNGSFELSTLGTGIPDGWSFAAIGAGAGAVSTGVVGHGAQSFGVTISGTGGGTLTQDELMPCNDGEVMALSFWNYTTDTATEDAVVVDWFAEDGTTNLGTDTIWEGGASRTVSTWQRMFAGMSAPAGARFFQISVSGGLTGTTTGDCYFDGLLVDTVIFKRRCEFHYTGSAVSFSYNFVPPTGVTMVRATLIGGGGKGAQSYDPAGGGGAYRGGGGAGGTVVAVMPVTPGANYTVVVGAGGTTVLAATASSFNTATATSGAAGALSNSPTGNGGTGGSGTVPAGSTGWVFPGGDGGESPSYGGQGGHGGSGYGGGGIGAIGAGVGMNGSNYGGGGGGGGITNGPLQGFGGNGFVFIEY